MTILSWNIQHGGGTRIARIVEEITAHDPDVIALTEFRTRPGEALSAALLDRGWPHVESTNPTGNQNGIAVLSRKPMRRTRQCPVSPENGVRWLDIDLPELGFGICVLHIMAAGRMEEVKTRFWDAVIGAAQARLNEPFLFIGEWNTGAHRVDESGKTFKCADHFVKLSALGWTDLWRHHNPGNTEWTWFSKLRGGVRGNGFRLDHAFATPKLLGRVQGCCYSHVERDAGISDHSILIIEVT